jgi:hypothetical protein
MDITYVANQTFARVHRDTNKYLFIRGPVGSGKSSGCIMHVFMNALNQEPDKEGIRQSRYAVLRSSYPALKSTVIRSWKQWFKDLKVVYDTPIKGTLQMPLPDGTKLEMEILFIALDREDEVNKLQSLELTGAHFNEMAEIPKGIFDMTKTRVSRFPSPMDGGPTHSFIIGDYNSVDIDHWLYKLAEEEKPRNHSFYSQPPAMLWTGEEYVVNPDADNLGHYIDGDPSQPPYKTCTWSNEHNAWWFPHLPEDYYSDIVDGNDEDAINIFVLNNYGALRKGRPVYKAYKDPIHASEKELAFIKGLPLVIGVDVGLTPAAAFCQLTTTGQLLILDEIVTENTSIQEFANDMIWPLIKSKYQTANFRLVMDPAAKARSQNDKVSAYDVFVKAGLPCELAKTNEPLARREAVNFFLRRVDGFLIDPSCNVLRKGFISEYKYEKISSSKADRFKEKPEKNIYSHVHDALQYACVDLAEGRFQVRKKRVGNHLNIGPADAGAGY